MFSAMAHVVHGLLIRRCEWDRTKIEEILNEGRQVNIRMKKNEKGFEVTFFFFFFYPRFYFNILVVKQH